MITANMENGTESRDLLPLIKEYESMIETLTTQVEFYAKEQENLRKEISALIDENKALAKTVTELLNAQSSTKEIDEQQSKEKDLIENLKKQLSLAMQEKDTVVQLWQNALKNIDYLEEELKLFEGRTHGYFSKIEVLKIKQKYEKQIAEIQEQLMKANLNLNYIKQDTSKNLENKNFDLKKALENREKTEETVKRLENEVDVLQTKLKEIIKLKDAIQNKLDLKEGIIEDLKKKEFEAKAKVTEAVQIVEAAFFEKDAALLRETKAKEEVVKISKTLTEIMNEATKKIKNETEKITQDCNQKIKEVQKSMEKLNDEINTKNIELERSTKENKLLEEELGRIRKGNICIDESNTSKLLVLERNLESTFQKLLVSERRNLQLTSEKEYIKADLEQMGNYYQNDIKSREIDMQVSKREIKKLQELLKISQSNLALAADKINKMNSKMTTINADVRKKLETKDMIHEEALKRTLELIQNDSEEEHNKIKKYLEKQKKWKNEIYDIIDTLEKHALELIEANSLLNQQLQKYTKNDKKKANVTFVPNNNNIKNIK